jgi:hypothetical protein
MRVSVQKNIDIVREVIRRYMLQAELQVAPHNIQYERPIEVRVAVSANNENGRPDRTQLIKNRLRANVAEMPDLISPLRHLPHGVRQAIVRIRKHEYMPSFSEVRVNCHMRFELSSHSTLGEYRRAQDDNTVCVAGAAGVLSEFRSAIDPTVGG